MPRRKAGILVTTIPGSVAEAWMRAYRLGWAGVALFWNIGLTWNQRTIILCRETPVFRQHSEPVLISKLGHAEALRGETC